MFQRAEEELEKELQSTLPPKLAKQLTGFEKIHGYLYMATAMDRGQDVDHKISPDHPYNYRLWDVADWTCHAVYINLASFLNVVKPGSSIPICKAGYFGKLNLTEDLLNPAEKFQQDEIVLLEHLLPELMFL